MPRSDAEANRTALLDAAARVLTSVGPRASLDAIAREAGVGIATLYRNFADRDELVRVLVHRAFAILAEFAAEAEHSSAEPVEALHTFLLHLIEQRARLTFLRSSPATEVDGPAALASPVTAVIEAVLGRGMADGTIRPDAVAADVIVAGVMLANPLLPDPAWDRAARRHVRLLVDGLRSRSSDSVMAAPLTPEELDRAFTGL